jgi:uncharacterized protein (DUF1499 family)
MLSELSKTPRNLGPGAGRLADCPDSPNCVSSQARRESQLLAAIPFHGSTGEAIDILKQVVAGMPRNKLVAEEPGYLHFEFRSFLFRFVDDVEFLVDETNAVIHFRSASRVGYSDLGVNRRRMEEVRKRFLEAAKPSDLDSQGVPQ